MRLTAKLSLLFLLLSVVPLSVVGFLAYDNGRRTIEHQTLNHLKSTNLSKESQFDYWVRDKAVSLEVIAKSPFFRDRFQGEITRPESADPGRVKAQRAMVEERLRPFLEGEGFFELFILRIDDGLVLISTDKKEEGKYQEELPYFVQGKARTYIQNVYYSMSLQQPALTVSTPLKDRTGRLQAVLAGRVDLTPLSRIMEQGRELNRSVDTYLVNTFNYFLTEPRFGRGYALKKSVQTEGVKAVLTHREGVGFYKDYRGVPVIGAYRWLAPWEMGLITEIDQEEAFAPIEEFKRKILGIGFLVALLATVVGWFSARTITRPVHTLIEGTEAIGSGLLDHPLSLSGKDEIGDLSRAFSRMAGKLRETMVSRDELSKEVAERQQTERALQEKNAELERFTYTISHDLKSPLVTIKSFMGYLEQDLVQAEPEKVKQDFFYMNSAADKMGQLLNELLEMSRIGRISNASVRVPFRELVEEALSLLAGPIAQRGAAVRVNDSPLTFFGDRPRLVEIWQNLVENAVKYLGDQGSPQIEIGVEGKGRNAVFWVRDNGQGIDPRHQGKVFGLFEKLNPESEGSGLGLALVKRIVEFYQGTIRLESAGLGQGTTVWFSLPGAVEDSK
jgi:signal transduction histidine kinase